MRQQTRRSGTQQLDGEDDNERWRACFGLEDDALLVPLGDVHERLRVEDLLASVPLGGHLQFELFLDLAVGRVEVLNLEASAVDAPFLLVTRSPGLRL